MQCLHYDSESLLPVKPHKVLPVNFFNQLLSGHRCATRATELSALPLSVPCSGLCLGSKEMRDRGGFIPLCRVDRPLDSSPNSSVAREQTSVLQPVFRSSGRSLPGPWENKGVRLHLFSVAVPRGIKGEDISSRPAWLGLTHLRGPFSPHSLRALFTHPTDMACGTVLA